MHSSLTGQCILTDRLGNCHTEASTTNTREMSLRKEKQQTGKEEPVKENLVKDALDTHHHD